MDITELKDLYKLLNCDITSSTEDILSQYNKRIKKYNKSILTKKETNRVKKLNIAKYILSNDDLREKYNTIYLSDYENSENKDGKGDSSPTYQKYNRRVTNDEINKRTFIKNIKKSEIDIPNYIIPLRKDDKLDVEAIGNRHFSLLDDNKNINFDNERTIIGFDKMVKHK